MARQHHQHEQEIDLGELLHGASLELDDHPEIVTAQRIIDCRCLLGEGILYCEKRRAVLWTDIYGKKFHKLQLDFTRGNKILYSTYQLPKMLCSFGLLEEADGATSKAVDEGKSLPLLCAWEDGFQIYDVVGGRPLSDVSRGQDVNPQKGPTRLNDGRTCLSGTRFVCGGYFGGVPGSNARSKVFKVEQREGDDGKPTLFHEPIINEIQTTNSICWTPDGNRMYLADSETREICTYAYDETTGELSDKRVLHEKPADASTVPDGSCVDSEGYLWNAVWCCGETKGMVQRIDPETGHVVYTVHIPDLVSQISCCCFGGENMDILFITSAADSRDKKIQPHAGALYAVKVPFKGRPESRLKFSYDGKTGAGTTNGNKRKEDAAPAAGNGEQEEAKKARIDADGERTNKDEEPKER